MTLTASQWKMVKEAEYKVFGHTLGMAKQNQETLTQLQNISLKNKLHLVLLSKESGLKPPTVRLEHEDLHSDESYEANYGGDPKNNKPKEEEIEMEDKRPTNNNLYNNQDSKKSMNKGYQGYETYQKLKPRTVKKTFTSYPDGLQIIKASLQGWDIKNIDADGAYTETIKRLNNREFGSFDGTGSDY